jgi:hypothetical protein
LKRMLTFLNQRLSLAGMRNSKPSYRSINLNAGKELRLLNLAADLNFQDLEDFAIIA